MVLFCKNVVTNQLFFWQQKQFDTNYISDQTLTADVIIVTYE